MSSYTWSKTKIKILSLSTDWTDSLLAKEITAKPYQQKFLAMTDWKVRYTSYNGFLCGLDTTDQQ